MVSASSLSVYLMRLIGRVEEWNGCPAAVDSCVDEEANVTPRRGSNASLEPIFLALKQPPGSGQESGWQEDAVLRQWQETRRVMVKTKEEEEGGEERSEERERDELVCHLKERPDMF